MERVKRENRYYGESSGKGSREEEEWTNGVLCCGSPTVEKRRRRIHVTLYSNLFGILPTTTLSLSLNEYREDDAGMCIWIFFADFALCFSYLFLTHSYTFRRFGSWALRLLVKFLFLSGAKLVLILLTSGPVFEKDNKVAKAYDSKW